MKCFQSFLSLFIFSYFW